MHVQLGCARDSATCARQSILALCRDRDLRVATLFPGMLGGLGRDIGLLCRDIDFSSLCHDRNSVSLQGLGVIPGLGRDKGLLMSRQGLGAGQGLGRDKGLLMSQQSFPKGWTFLSRQKTLCWDRNSKGGVVTGCFSVVTHKAGLRTQKGVGCTRHA